MGMVMETREKCRGSLTQPGRNLQSPVDETAWGEHEHERRDGMLIALHLVKEDARCSLARILAAAAVVSREGEN